MEVPDIRNACCLDEATRSLWEGCSRELLRFIRSRVSDPVEAEDILQDVFLRIHSGLDHLRDTSRLQSWMYQIVRNAIIDHYRRRRPQTDLSEDLPHEDELEFEPDIAESLAPSIREMVGSLPEPYRQAILLADFEGLTQKELADRLGISLSGAKSRVQRARKQVRDMLLICCHFEFDTRGVVIGYHEPHCCCCTMHKPH